MTEQTEPTSMLMQQRKTTDILILMVAVSLLLHGAISLIVMLPARHGADYAQPLFVDLAQLPVSVAPDPAVKAEEVTEEELPKAAQMPPEEAVETAPEMAKLQQDIATSLDKAAIAPEMIHESAIGLGMTAGYFGSFADGETLRDEIREYYFALMRRINEVWWQNAAATSPLARGAALNIVITREGKIAAVEFFHGSGDVAYDRLLLESLKKAEPLPLLPRNFTQPTFSAPIRFVPPLNLMLPQLTRRPLPHNGSN